MRYIVAFVLGVAGVLVVFSAFLANYINHRPNVAFGAGLPFRVMYDVTFLIAAGLAFGLICFEVLR